jgi:ferredoxin/flavodoxin---NADP+ reductase
MSPAPSVPRQLHRVLGHRWHGEGVYEIELERNGLQFVPGDCVAIFAPDGVGSRPYSIASGTGEAHLGFLIRRMPGGEVSDHLARLRPGDEVWLSPPFGWFRPGETAGTAPFVFVATGTGLSPFLSHLRSRPDAPPRQLFVGVRQAADRVDPEGLAASCETHFAVSREDAPGCHRGRVTDLVDRIHLAPDCQYYLCGLDDMIDEVTRALEARGIPPRHIHRECFFNAQYE